MAIKSGVVFTDHKWLSIDDDTIGKYNYLDCLATSRVRTALRQEQADNLQLEFYEKSYWPLVPVIMDMAKRGMWVDQSALACYRTEVLNEIRECEEAITNETGLTINYNSNPQRASLLYGALGLKCHRYTDTGAKSTDQEALDLILRKLLVRERPALPTLHALFHRSRYSTILERYLDLPIEADGCVRSTVKMGSVETLRLAYSNPPLQQWPKESRYVFKARRGKLYVALDYSQLEARILAYLSGDQPSTMCFTRGQDIHTQNTMDLFSWDEEAWSSMETRVRESARNTGKSFLYGISYGGKGETLHLKIYCPCEKCSSKVPATYEVSRKDMREAEARWSSKHYAVQLWRDKLIRDVVASGKTYTNPLGYKSHFFSPTYKTITQIYNRPMQSTAACIMNRATIEMGKVNIPLVLQMHDELIAECPASEARFIAYRMKEIMEAPIPEMGGVVFPVEISMGEDWGHLEKVTL